MSVDLDQFRARMLEGSEMQKSQNVNAKKSVTATRKTDQTMDSIEASNADEDDDDDDDEDLYENDSVEMEDDERKEIDMADSLLIDDDFRRDGDQEEDKDAQSQRKTKETLLKENSPVLRMSFTKEEVENLRQRVRHSDGTAS